MRIRPLPDIDLARISSLPRELQRKQLEQMRHGRPPFSYAPLRSCFHDIFNVQPEMFGPVDPTDWSVIESLLRKKCRSSDELKANIAVARGLHTFAEEAKLLGRTQEFFPLAMSAGRKVSYWLPMVLAKDDQAIVPFIDPRRSRGLTKAARRFAFSMMNERIRIADPDYDSVRFAIFQFGNDKEGARHPTLHTDEDIQLHSFDELEAMVSTTYSLWQEVHEEREMESRRKGTGTFGPLL